ncbi:hypothetical protein HDV00_010741 [Rhizophlyctis rosea]|nr:hypothetical protein HDV00_010741 [Rhizophlyctis rosea]
MSEIVETQEDVCKLFTLAQQDGASNSQDFTLEGLSATMGTDTTMNPRVANYNRAHDENASAEVPQEVLMKERFEKLNLQQKVVFSAYEQMHTRLEKGSKPTSSFLQDKIRLLEDVLEKHIRSLAATEIQMESIQRDLQKKVEQLKLEKEQLQEERKQLEEGKRQSEDEKKQLAKEKKKAQDESEQLQKQKEHLESEMQKLQDHNHSLKQKCLELACSTRKEPAGTWKQYTTYGMNENTSHPREVLIRRIDNAESRILIMMYRFTDNILLNHLISAHENGRKVRILLHPDGKNEPVAKRAREAGIKVRWAKCKEGHFANFHEKSMIVDDDRLITGTYNYTSNAYERNHESIFILKNCPSRIQAAVNRF